MDPKDLARWAAKFAKKGVAAAVPDRPPAHQPAGPPRAGERWGSPWGAPVRGSTWGGKPPELETLVKPGPSAYADILASVPELAPNLEGGDSMEGPISGASAQARDEALGGQGFEGVRPDDPRDMAPRGYRGMPSNGNVLPLADLAKKLPN